MQDASIRFGKVLIRDLAVYLKKTFGDTDIIQNNDDAEFQADQIVRIVFKNQTPPAEFCPLCHEIDTKLIKEHNNKDGTTDQDRECEVCGFEYTYTLGEGLKRIGGKKL